MQMTVLMITLLLMAAVAWVFVATVRASNGPRGSAAQGVGSQSAGTVEGRRKSLFWVLLGVGAVITPVSIWSWPHAVSADGEVVTINATGGQWYWSIDLAEVPVGRRVAFNVHSEDVNHGLGVYDEAGRLLFQTQGMPGYVNRVEYVFETPGRYRVLCMEFCGVGHHEMLDEFQVVAAE